MCIYPCIKPLQTPQWFPIPRGPKTHGNYRTPPAALHLVPGAETSYLTWFLAQPGNCLFSAVGSPIQLTDQV